MPRTARRIEAGGYYHVLSRANEKARVFRDEADYAHFMELFDRACRRFGLPVHAYCLMPTHFHAVVRPTDATQLARWAHWLLTTHASHHRKRYGGAGHVWQGRYKAFAVQDDSYLSTVLAYVERNAVRAGIVETAEQWAWGSARWLLLDWQPAWLMPRPWQDSKAWLESLKRAESAEELEQLRTHARTGLPLGDSTWRERIAEVLGIRSSPGRRGRPRKMGTVPNFDAKQGSGVP